MLMLHHGGLPVLSRHCKRQQFLALALRLVSDPQLERVAIVDRRRDVPKQLAAGPNGFVACGSKVGKLQTSVIKHRLPVVRMEEIARHWSTEVTGPISQPPNAGSRSCVRSHAMSTHADP